MRASVTFYDCEGHLRRRGFRIDGDPPLLRPRRTLIHEIQIAVAKRFEIPLFEMTSDRRAKEVSRPRQVAMYLSKNFTKNSLPEIGRRFGNRDHTTVMHAIKRIAALRLLDDELDADVCWLEAALA